MLVNDKYISLAIVLEKIDRVKLPGQEYSLSDVKEWAIEAMEKLRLVESLVAHTISDYITTTLTIVNFNAILPEDFDREYSVLNSSGGVMTLQTPPSTDNTYDIIDNIIYTNFDSGTVTLNYYATYHHRDALVENYRAILPDNYYRLIAVYEYDTKIPLVELSNEEQFKESSYKVFNNYIRTDFETGAISIEYYSIMEDSNGLPLIPDKIEYISAVEAYLRTKIGEKLFWQGKINQQQLDKLIQVWKETAGDAHSESKIISKEKLKRENLRNFPAIDISVPNLYKATSSTYLTTSSLVGEVVYGTLSAAYADDADYNDIIATISVTNNTATQQTCVLFFRLNDGAFARYIALIPKGETHTFEHIFDNVDIFQENIVRVYNSSFELIDSVTIAAEDNTPFEMSWVDGVGTATFNAGNYLDTFYIDIENDNDTNYEHILISNPTTLAITISKQYTTSSIKTIIIDSPRLVDRLECSSNFLIEELNLKKLRNIRHFQHFADNLRIKQGELQCLKKLRFLVIGMNNNIRTYPDELKKLKYLAYINIYNTPNVAIESGTFINFNLILLQLYNLPLLFISKGEINMSSCIYFRIMYCINVEIGEKELSTLSQNYPKNSIIRIQNIKLLEIASDEIFPSHYLFLGNNNMTAESVDNVFISCYNQLLGGFVPDTKNINVAGINAKVTSASLTARNYLLSQGYVLTFNS